MIHISTANIIQSVHDLIQPSPSISGEPEVEIMCCRCIYMHYCALKQKQWNIAPADLFVNNNEIF